MSYRRRYARPIHMPLSILEARVVDELAGANAQRRKSWTLITLQE